MKMRKFGILGYSRSIFTDPFLVSMLAFLVILCRSFPFFFSIVVSASPVLVCTAVLLGTLLRFGKPISNGIEKERPTLEIGVSGDNVVFQRSKRVSPKSCDEEEVVEENSLVADEISMLDIGGTSPQLLEQMSWAGNAGERVLEKNHKETEELGFEYKKVKGRELEDFGFKYKSEMFENRLSDKRTLGNQYSLIMEKEDEHFDLETDSSSIDSKVIHIHAIDFPPDSVWKYVNEEDEENNNDDEASELGSDRTECSSPGASMADDIIPMLDELHPLLDEVIPLPANLYQDGSDTASGRSEDSSNESDDDSEHPEEREVADDENGNGESEAKTRGVQEDHTKSAISWTEEDQKNLKNLRTSELERNQRLENLIATRQRARRTMKMMTEKNLIDFDDTDLPHNVPHILAKRTNPFDLFQDSYENMGLPSIPGSAPSVLLPMKNPFALPYDSSDENPDLMEDYFDQDLVPFPSKEKIFCRHESFNIRPSFVGTNKAEKQSMSRYRHYFVSENLGSEGRSYSTFTRQSSELSDSKMSSSVDTESTDSDGYLKEPNFNEEETSMMKVRNYTEEDVTQNTELLYKIEDTSKLIGHGGESSEDEDSLELGQVEKRHMIVDEIERKLHVEDHKGTQTQEIPGFIEERNRTEKSRISVQSSPPGSHSEIRTTFSDDTPQKDPIYDSSPTASMKNLSSLSISSGAQDNSENGLLPIMVKRSVSFSERVTELGSRNMKSNKMFGHEMLDGLTGMIPENKNEMELEGDAEISEQLYINEKEPDLKMVASTIEGKMVQEVNFDLSEVPEDKFDQVADFASALQSNGSKNTEGAFPESLLVLGRHLLDTPKQHKEFFPSVPLKTSEFRIVEDVWSEVNSTKEEEPKLKEHDKMEASLNALEEPDCAIKTPEVLDVVASDVSRA